ncbi:hypothetical protein [Janthinobacterium fluminis]|uniref:Porin n=1 Tax=Janthinobacterium fluminis TaxID=2987524 RepID=A0ABT5JV54_9BURK|nr:hypothetical protein [Janthinobacterium fluminis]MDC8756617.1 hypothetical protein [Janthinobacterium fluminis]
MSAEKLQAHIALAGIRRGAALLLCALPHILCRADDADAIAELKRAVASLREENRALTRRLDALAEQRAGGLDQRVQELESAKIAQEDAVRAIIRDSLSKVGPKINEAAALGGTLSARLARDKDFSGARNSALGLGSIDFELDIKMSEWASGHIKIDYLNGQGAAPIQGSAAPLDRLAVDTGYITLGNQQKFPPLLSIGRMVLPFGTSTGHPVTDALSVGSALTVDAFEMRHNAIGLNFAFPTPPLLPRSPPVIAPAVKPQLFYPIVRALAHGMGYAPPPARPAAPTPQPEETPPPTYSAGVYVYEGLTPGGNSRHFGASLGYRAKGHCGRPYEELRGIGVCPWAVDLALSYNSSVFNSLFLGSEYAAHLGQIGRVPGVAASIRSTLGPFALVGEWNSATRPARFRNDAGAPLAIRPAAWQISLGYQLGWNPWVREIGAQGSYLSIGYSRSRDLAGTTRMLDTTPTRFGFLPRQRLLLTFGEWVVDGVRFSIEYSRDWDYAPDQGGSGRTASGLAAMLTYAW